MEMERGFLVGIVWGGISVSGWNSGGGEGGGDGKGWFSKEDRKSGRDWVWEGAGGEVCTSGCVISSNSFTELLSVSSVVMLVGVIWKSIVSVGVLLHSDAGEFSCRIVGVLSDLTTGSSSLRWCDDDRGSVSSSCCGATTGLFSLSWGEVSRGSVSLFILTTGVLPFGGTRGCDFGEKSGLTAGLLPLFGGNRGFVRGK